MQVFEDWAEEQGISYGTRERHTAYAAWNARQQEIDALKQESDKAWTSSMALADGVMALRVENAALKDEVEQLRKDKQKLKDAITITWQGAK